MGRRTDQEFFMGDLPGKRVVIWPVHRLDFRSETVGPRKLTERNYMRIEAGVNRAYFP
jgi:hypothetical protein